MAGRVQEGIATRARLIAAAEKLFAKHGIEGASIRDISAEAEVNSAAAHYHFGTKADLVAAVLEARVDEVRQRRREILDQIDEGAQTVEHQIAEALVRPNAEMGDDYTSFIVVIGDHPDFQAMATKAFEDQSAELLQLLRDARPDLAPDVAACRYAIAQVVANQMLGRRRRRTERWLRQLLPGVSVNYPEVLIQFLTAALSAPPSEAETKPEPKRARRTRRTTSARRSK